MKKSNQILQIKKNIKKLIKFKQKYKTLLLILLNYKLIHKHKLKLQLKIKFKIYLIKILKFARSQRKHHKDSKILDPI